MSSTIKQALALAESTDGREFVFEYNDKQYSAGESVPKEEADGPPTLRSASSTLVGPLVAICVDLDAPFPSLSLLSPINHWIQPGLQQGASTILETEQECVVNWYPAEPPKNSAPHRYLAMLYKQPADFDSLAAIFKYNKPVALRKRLRWDVDNFVRKTGLKEMVGANWFTV